MVWCYSARVNTLDKELIKALKATGTKIISTVIEAGNIVFLDLRNHKNRKRVQ